MSSRSVHDTLLEAADMASTVKTGLQVVERIAGGNKTADAAISALAVIEALAKTLHRGMAGELHADDVAKEMNTLRAGLLANDAAAQSEIDKKFPTG